MQLTCPMTQPRKQHDKILIMSKNSSFKVYKKLLIFFRGLQYNVRTSILGGGFIHECGFARKNQFI